MLCSKCSETIKPIVAIDIDGTLGDYHTHFIVFAEDWIGRQLPRARSFNGGQTMRSWFNEACGVGHKEWHEIKLAYRQGGMKRTMPIRGGAASLCGAVRKLGAELWLTTTRPYLSLDNIVPDTVEWCRRNGIEYDGMLFDEDKYAQLADRVDSSRVVLVLDDLEEMCEAAAKVLHYGHDVPVLADNRYNRAMSWPIRTTPAGAISIANRRIKEWKEMHAELELHS